MSDLIVGIGIALIAEGLFWALAPNLATRCLEMIAATPVGQVRTTAWIAVAAGVGIVWWIRG